MQHQFHNNNQTLVGLFLALLLLALCSFLIAINSGSVDIGLIDWFGSFLPGNDSQLSKISNQVIYELRIPRALAAFTTGAMLALSGVLMQVLLRNPLADPYILGVSGGAAVAALASILLGLSGVWVSYAAFGGALTSILLVFGLAAKLAGWSSTRLLLTGVVISAGWGAMINILLTTSTTNTVQSMLFWLMGDLSQSQVSLFQPALLVVGSAVALFHARSLNVLARGDHTAHALGVNVNRLRVILYLLASLLTASAVTVAGSVGFVGLIIPHILRLIGARDHRLLIPASLLLGGSFLSIADTLSRTIVAPQQLPVGVVTAIIGVPAFLIILRSTAKLSSGKD